MANRRMFSVNVICSDRFMCMSNESQSVYFQIMMRCDDDGFCNSLISIMRMLGCTENALNELLDKGFILRLNDEVYAITDFRSQNLLRKNRYKPTKYMELAKKIFIDADDKYTLNETSTRLFDLITKIVSSDKSKKNDNDNSEDTSKTNGRTLADVVQVSSSQSNLDKVNIASVITSQEESLEEINEQNIEVSLNAIQKFLENFDFLKTLNSQTYIELMDLATSYTWTQKQLNNYCEWLIRNKMNTAKKKLRYFVSIFKNTELIKEFNEIDSAKKTEQNTDNNIYCPGCNVSVDKVAGKCPECGVPISFIMKGTAAVKEYYLGMNSEGIKFP